MLLALGTIFTQYHIPNRYGPVMYTATKINGSALFYAIDLIDFTHGTVNFTDFIYADNGD